LQRSFFDIHPDINFGGIGCGSNIDFSDQKLELIFESYLKYANTLFWEKNKLNAKKIISGFLSSEKINVFSSEYLSLTITNQGIDLGTRLQRLKYLFSENATIIIILRNQIKLIESIYREFVRLGAIINYSEFIQYLYIYQDRNFFYELLYCEVYNLLLNVGFQNIDILYFENITNNPTELINNYFQNKYGIRNYNLTIANDNPSLSLNQYEQLLLKNKFNRRGLGSHHFDGFEKHRNRELFNTLNTNYCEEEIYNEVALKRKLIKELDSNGQYNNLYQLDERSKIYLERMIKIFEKNNTNLEAKLNKKPPESFLRLHSE